MAEMIDRAYRDIIATKVHVSDVMDIATFQQKNEEKSWQYRRYPKFNENFICISKDGVIGEIWKVGDLIIGLPSSEGKEIINIDEEDRHNCIWKRTEIPLEFKKLEVSYRRDMRKIKGLKRNQIKEDYKNERKDLMKKYKTHIDREFDRRKNGVFIKIDNQICYLTGPNYMFLNYYFLAEDKIYPKFRVTAMHTWWHWEAVCADQSSWGELRLKSRRVSWTSEACSIAIDNFTKTKYGEIPIVSENDRLAKKLFTGKIVNSFPYYPTFFKPLIEDPNDKAKSSLEIVFETDDQETSMISVYPTKAVSYDSTKANPFGINDEVGKYENVPFTEFRGNHKDCYFQGLKKVVAKGKFGSTAGEFSKGGESFQYEFENANPLERDSLGVTKTGLIALFVDDCYTMAGFFDKWGFPIVYDPIEPILGEYGDWIEYGSLSYWNAEYEKKKKGKKSDLNNFLRQHPRTIAHAFRDTAGSNNDFDINNLNNHEEFLSSYPKDELDKIIHKGNLVWTGEPYESDVRWIPNENGKFQTTWIPPKELQNQFEEKSFYGKKFNFPLNNGIGIFGVDPYNISDTVDGKGSEGAMAGLSKFNMAGCPSKSFFLKYLHRPDKREDFYDDVIKCCRFFGMYAVVESNKERLIEHMAEKGYRGYSLTRPDKKWKDLSEHEKDYGGIPSSKPFNEDVANLLKDYIVDFIGQNLSKECYCYFIEMIKEWKKFNIKKRKKFDLSVACQLALFGSQYKVKMRKNVKINNTEEYPISLSDFGA